ncbi:hypothetical protein DH2020_009466 [Rehmannia glutinosa]|uniref:LOB domain-containing protein n=1 Tax=Rehmannia glutinosa TaxID=99300 RepID=A0ABR0X6D3_REHGL
MAASSSNYSNPPCAACKFLRRKCLPGCIFSPYFPPEDPTKFFNVHKIFGASNVSKLLNEIAPHQREDAVNSLAYEAEARLKDPVYGCVGAISVLQRQVISLQKELDATNANIMRFANEIPCYNAAMNPGFGRRVMDYGRVLSDPSSGFSLPYPWPWNNTGCSGDGSTMKTTKDSCFLWNGSRGF